MNTRLRRLAIAAFIIAALYAAAFLYPRSQPAILEPGAAVNVSGVPNIVRERMLWQERIQIAGAASAYEEFKRIYGTLEFGRRHTMAHLWGEVLFTASGLNGVVVCDSAFEFGCYHGFFTAAVGANGIGILPELDRACRSEAMPSACQHGIGHGILEYFGHDKLETALESCAAVPQLEPVAGCTAGVFMEYNLPITIVPGVDASMKFRPVNDENPYTPCPDLPREFRQSCYHELVQLWDRYYDYQKIGKLCAELENGAERDACFQGAGNIAVPSSQYDVAAAIGKCLEMPGDDGQAICRIASSWSFWAQEHYRHLAPEPCRGLAPDIVARCAPPNNR